MRIRLVVNVASDSGDTRWEREVDRPYPDVPRAQDWVFLGDGDGGEGFAATPVAVVSWENDGTVALRFDVASTGTPDAGWLQQLGFTRA